VGHTTCNFLFTGKYLRPGQTVFTRQWLTTLYASTRHSTRSCEIQRAGSLLHFSDLICRPHVRGDGSLLTLCFVYAWGGRACVPRSAAPGDVAVALSRPSTPCDRNERSNVSLVYVILQRRHRLPTEFGPSFCEANATSRQACLFF